LNFSVIASTNQGMRDPAAAHKTLSQLAKLISRRCR